MQIKQLILQYMLTVFKVNIEIGLILFILLISIYLFVIQWQQRPSIVYWLLRAMGNQICDSFV